MPRRFPSLVASLILVTGALHAHPTGAAIGDMVGAAQSWLDSLSTEQRRSAQHPFASAERENWHYVPRSREGVSLGEMSDAQRNKARALLASGLSQQGLLQAESVIALEQVLRVVENASYRDESRYYFTVFDSPTSQGTWGWRVEGHHLSLNVTIVQGRHIVATPHFVGANPAEVRIAGPQVGKRALAAEEDLARKLVLSFDERQRARAVFSTSAPSDILTRSDRQAKRLDPAGLPFGEMTDAQQSQFQELFNVYAGRLRDEVAEAERQKVAKAGWEKTSFAWAGGFEPGEGHYYRIQSPDFVIEYDNTQNRANHIHTVWRSFRGDFGRDLLQDHYREAHR